MHDQTLTCRDCGQAFTFTSGENEFYASRGFSEPTRCASCRQARKSERGDSGGGYSSGGGGGYGGRGSREMFSATCSGCGQEAQVPFQPSGEKPVYCSSCFQQRGGGGGGAGGRGGSGGGYGRRDRY